MESLQLQQTISCWLFLQRKNSFYRYLECVHSYILLTYVPSNLSGPLRKFMSLLTRLGSIGTAPVPSAGIVIIITCYETTFGGSEVPYGVAFLFAFDWLIDRFCTMFNVMGDTIVAAVVSSRLDEEAHEEFLNRVVKVDGHESIEPEKTERMGNCQVEDHDTPDAESQKSQ